MKVERKLKPFNPVTITLETQEEADRMWHLLNCAFQTSEEDYRRGKYLSKPNLELSHGMWLEFDSAYRPEDEQ